MPSFDVVSKVDMQEVDNAVNQAIKEVEQRYDFKGTHNEIKLEKDAINILASDDYKLQAIIDILRGKFARRNVSPKSLDPQKKENGSHGTVRQKIAIIQGISKEKAKDVIAAIKESKLKVQPQIMDDQVRVSGKQLDDLQEVIALLKTKDFGIELQYINFRQ